MIDYLVQDLAVEEQSEFHRRMLEDSKSLINISRRKMSQFYPVWDRNDQVYRSQLQSDAEDVDARNRKEPAKMIVPLTYAQVQTFISFCFSLYTQRQTFFELLPMNAQSAESAKVGEAFLTRDLNYNQWESRLYQFLLDLARYGVGVIKTGWVHETQKTKVLQPVASGPNPYPGAATAPTMQEVEILQTQFLGNRIWNISPYRFYPDTRIPLYRFQEGEFCASEELVNFTQLKQWEKEGLVTGVDFIKPFSKPLLDARGYTRWPTEISQPGTELAQTSTQSKGTMILTEIQRVLVPSQYLIGDQPLGVEDYPVKYNIWYVNDNRVIKCEPLNYAHNKFTYDIAEFSPDMNALVNASLADSIDSLQAAVSWFINSRIANVRKIIGDKIVVDPEGVEMKDIIERRPVIRLKPTAGGRGVDKFVKQLDLIDVTTGHVADAKYLIDLAQLVTGINDNILGQFHSGRRSATEARNVTSSAASRLKMVALLVFRSAIEPMGRKMLSNLRDGLDEPTYVRLMGPIAAAKGVEFLEADKNDIQGQYEFEVFDGTLPSERGLSAQTLQELLIEFFKNPQVAIALGIDPKQLLTEILYLRGIRAPERFLLNLPPQPNGQPGPTSNVSNPLGPATSPSPTTGLSGVPMVGEGTPDVGGSFAGLTGQF